MIAGHLVCKNGILHYNIDIGANEAYIALTVHFINDIVSLTAACKPFPGQHTAPLMAGKILEMITDIGLHHSDVVCCVMDNEPTANAAGDHMPFPWMGCIDHLIELVTGVAFNVLANLIAHARGRSLIIFLPSLKPQHFCTMHESRLVRRSTYRNSRCCNAGGALKI